ncbi:MAG: hypothetical protein Q9227_004842 [Pyrenula ochraceoflavens]
MGSFFESSRLQRAVNSGLQYLFTGGDTNSESDWQQSQSNIPVQWIPIPGSLVAAAKRCLEAEYNGSKSPNLRDQVFIELLQILLEEGLIEEVTLSGARTSASTSDASEKDLKQEQRDLEDNRHLDTGEETLPDSESVEAEYEGAEDEHHNQDAEIGSLASEESWKAERSRRINEIADRYDRLRKEAGQALKDFRFMHEDVRKCETPEFYAEKLREWEEELKAGTTELTSREDFDWDFSERLRWVRGNLMKAGEAVESAFDNAREWGVDTWEYHEEFERILKQIEEEDKQEMGAFPYLQYSQPILSEKQWDGMRAWQARVHQDEAWTMASPELDSENLHGFDYVRDIFHDPMAGTLFATKQPAATFIYSPSFVPPGHPMESYDGDEDGQNDAFDDD